MSFPAARVGDMTVTGDAITGPGVPTVLLGGMPAAVVGDSVSGNACVGAIAMGSTTVLIGGRPAARVTSQVAGANPYSGVPVTTAVAPPGAPTVLIGG
ncbi:MAG: PAAR domain-containing protein [Anaerolineae bacterium]|nr:PAAR domain-containing protein [Anaerolineae bacterium]